MERRDRRRRGIEGEAKRERVRGSRRGCLLILRVSAEWMRLHTCPDSPKLKEPAPWSSCLHDWAVGCMAGRQDDAIHMWRGRVARAGMCVPGGGVRALGFPHAAEGSLCPLALLLAKSYHFADLSLSA